MSNALDSFGSGNRGPWLRFPPARRTCDPPNGASLACRICGRNVSSRGRRFRRRLRGPRSDPRPGTNPRWPTGCWTPALLGQPEPTYPLVLVFCNRCTLLQITRRCPPKSCFGITSTSPVSPTRWSTMPRPSPTDDSGAASGSEQFGRGSGQQRRIPLASTSRAVAFPVLGIEPARNVAAVAIEKGVPTVSEFSGPSWPRN